ncbi:MAG: hypothetical protein Q4C83_02850 [Candidatus Saccharibacteria bacterium]|nr:hypothetical protein [Candidatus Saccharibacteria bacterium]
MTKTKASYKVRTNGNISTVYYDGFDSGRAVFRFNTNIVDCRYQLPIYRFLTQYLLKKEWSKINVGRKAIGVESHINYNGVLFICINFKDKLAMEQIELENAIGLVLDAINRIRTDWMERLDALDCVSISLDKLGLPSEKMPCYASIARFDAVKESMRPDAKTLDALCGYNIDLVRRAVHRGAYYKFLAKLFSKENVRTTIYVNSSRDGINMSRIAVMLSSQLSVYQQPKMINWSRRAMLQDEAHVSVVSQHSFGLAPKTFLGCVIPFSRHLWATIMVISEIAEKCGVCEVLYFNDTLCLSASGDSNEVIARLRRFTADEYADVFTSEQIQLAVQRLMANKQYLLDRIISGYISIDVDTGITDDYRTGFEIDVIEKLSKVTIKDIETVFAVLANSPTVVRSKVVETY